MDEERVRANQGGLVRTLIGVVVIIFVVSAGAALSYLGKGLPDPWLGEVLKVALGYQLTIVEVVAIISFAINFLVYIPAFAFQTEKFYDLTGSVTYLCCVWYSYAAGMTFSSGSFKYRPTIASALVSIWALRLGSFLFKRVLEDNGDSRFTEIKPNAIRFLVAWTLQGLWVFLTAFAVFVANASADGNLGPLDFVGLAIWLLGFGIEVLADNQKARWRKQPGNKGKFIEYGLWYYSRHPNYCGEFTLWLGMWVLCASAMSGTQFVTALSPVFVFCLLMFVSGVPLLEKKADQKWGGQPDYENYKKTTSVFFVLPKLGKRIMQ